MKTKIMIRLTAFLLLAFLLSEPIDAQDAAEILKKMDEISYAPRDQVSRTTITLVDKNGTESIRKADMKQKGRNMRLTRFMEPASQKGIAFLSLPDDVMYIYLPAFGTERRIASHVKNQSFAGTDFTYEDMEAVPYSEKFDPVLLEDRDAQWIMQLTPKPGLQSDYSKIILIVNKSNYCSEQVEFFNRGGIKTKVLTSKAEKINGYWTNRRLEMNSLLKGHKTIIYMDEVLFDQNLSDDEFSVRKLKQGL
jgi:outer membrane lipoprotein-sorting protein